MQPQFSDRLQDLVLESADLQAFAERLSGAAADFAEEIVGGPVRCSVRLRRPRNATILAGSCPEALVLEQLQDRLLQGPGLEVLEHGGSAVVRDAAADGRWSKYLRAAALRGHHSLLGIGLGLEKNAKASLGFYAAGSGVFDAGIASRCTAFAEMAGRATRLAVRIAATQAANRDLLQAMQSRSIISLASGILMGQSRCSQAEAFALLTRASNNRNIKLRDVAEEILHRFDSGPGPADFRG